MKANELPIEADRELIEGKLPLTQKEWDQKPRDYKCEFSETLQAPTTIFLSREGETRMQAVILVEADRIKMKSTDNLQPAAKVRTISFDGNTTDPYVLSHEDSEQLTDGAIEARHAEYMSRRTESETDDDDAQVLDFEAFLEWLEANYGYRQFVVADAMLEL